MLHEAIAELYDTVVFIQGNKVDDVVAKDKNGVEVSIDKDDVTAKITELENATAYVHARKGDYPNNGEQLDMLYHDMTAGKGDKTGDWYKAIKKVKDDNPK